MTDTMLVVRKYYEAKMYCNCDLDNWQPEPNTGHSWVCRIHKAITATLEYPNRYEPTLDDILKEADDD